MLKFSVGYQFGGVEKFSEIVRAYRDGIAEVYFSLPTEPSGRPVLCADDAYISEFLADLKCIKKLGVGLNLLLNANCYGADAISLALQEKVCALIDFLGREELFPDGITTTSPAIAYIVRNQYPSIAIKASVNMKIGTVKGMEYVSELFDGFCLAKECNRDMERLGELRAWATENGKKLTILANSGCMRDCSGQIFHDNMVAHAEGIAQKEKLAWVPYVCWNFLKNRENFPAVLQNTWIRPEDICHYEGVADCIKLATRTHELPGMVIDSYIRRRYAGNLLDLFEPGYGPAFAPWIVDSAKIPQDFWEQTTRCDKRCQNCNYCKTVMEEALCMG